jgi:transitional endoplasmic reticulum ATPase
MAFFVFKAKSEPEEEFIDIEEEEEESADMDPDRWMRKHGVYMATTKPEIVLKLDPGIYDLGVAPDGTIFFVRVERRSDALLRFPDTAITTVVDEIEGFWNREAAFEAHELPYKRGILLHGPPGSGKSCTLRLIGEDVVERGGIVILFTEPKLFVGAYRLFRTVQPDTPMVVMMEDLDGILEKGNESYILNLLDGLELIHKICFLATTNYVEKLSARIGNRPSRFDRKYHIPHPNAPSRRMYLESLMKEGDKVDLDLWVRDTDGFSLAHLKELFVGVVILQGTYRHVLKAMQEMHETTSSVDDDPLVTLLRQRGYS